MQLNVHGLQSKRLQLPERIETHGGNLRGLDCHLGILEGIPARSPGIEPGSAGLEAAVLPLDHERV